MYLITYLILDLLSDTFSRKEACLVRIVVSLPLWKGIKISEKFGVGEFLFVTTVLWTGSSIFCDSTSIILANDVSNLIRSTI